MEPTLTQAAPPAPVAAPIVPAAPVTSPAPTSPPAAAITQYSRLEFRRKFWKWFGAEINVTDPATEQSVGYIKMKAWKLREDVRLFSDQTMQTEIIRINARQIIDFGATYDITDSATNLPLASLRRKGWKSALVRDYWEILDTTGTVIGEVKETSGTLALMRRWLGTISDLFDLIFMFVVQTYTINDTRTGTPVQAASIIHRKNPAVVKMGLDATNNHANMDPRILIAATALLSIMDAAKNA